MKPRTAFIISILIFLVVMLFIFSTVEVKAQEIEVRRWVGYTFIYETIKLDTLVAGMFFSLLTEYCKECYNDSTLIISGGGYTPNVPIVFDSLGRATKDYTKFTFELSVYIISREWVHKEPTLIGFKNFLDKK